MNKPSRKYLTIFKIAILTLLTSCQGGITPVPTPTETNTPTPIVSNTKTPTTLNAVENIMGAIRTQAASVTEEPPTLQVDNTSLIPIKKRLGKGVTYAAAVSPDGKTIAVTGQFTVSIYDFKSLEEIWASPLDQIVPQLPLSPLYQGGVAWSSDSAQLATLSEMGVSVWDARTGKLLYTFKKPHEGIFSIGWTRDGNPMASGFNVDTQETLLWNVQTGEKVFSKQSSSYVWSPRNDILALVKDFNEISVWDISTNQMLYSPVKVCNSRCTGGMIWSSDGTQLALSDSGGDVSIWDVQTGKQRLMERIKEGTGVLSMAWSPNDDYLVAALTDRMVVIWDAQTGKQLRMLESGLVLVLSWSPDGKNLITLSGPMTLTRSNVLTIWDIQTGEKLRFLDEHASAVLDVVWSPSGDMLASSFEDGEVIIWDPSSGKKLRSFHDPEGWVTSLDWSPNGEKLASGGRRVVVWDIQTGGQIQILSASTQETFKVDWSPDAKKLALTSYDGQGSIWDATTGEKLLDLKKNRFSRYIAWSPKGDLLGTSYPLLDTTRRQQVTLWNPQTGEEILTQPGLYNLVWSPLGNTVASVSDNGTLYEGDDKTLVLWDAKTGKEIYRINTDIMLFSLDWSPNGNFLVAAQSSLVMLDARTGKQTYRFEGHPGVVSSVAWSPHGDLIASSSQDGIVIIWEVEVH
ncbi:MAG: WD40 repeat domain-containing protein [Chloroflexi bacterium]|nr:WD40 repeat domain-containing protein [Chloroflexota bacterium]